MNESPNSAFSAPPDGQSLSPGLTDTQALRAASPTMQSSLAGMQSSAMRELDTLKNQAMVLGVQFPFLAQQIQAFVGLAEDSKLLILQTLGPEIAAEAQSQGSALTGQPGMGVPSGLSPMPLETGGGTSY